MSVSPNLSNLHVNSKGVAVAAFLLMLLFAALPFSVPNATGISVSPVQDLVDSAKPGDTIYVPAGHYYGQVNIDKSVKLVGEGSTSTILYGDDTGDVVAVSANVA